MKKKIYKFYPYIFCILGILFSVLIWDHLTLPYDENNLIQGTAFNKKLNPYNNTIRVLFFIFFPISIFLISFLSLKKKILSLNPLSKEFFLTNTKCFFFQNQNINYFNNFFWIFLIYLFLEFCSLNFTLLLAPVDMYHDGLTLVPSIIYQKYKTFWSSIHFDYGIGGNLRPVFIWEALNIKSIGSIRFLDQFINLIIKIILLVICRKISLIFFKKNNLSFIFFLLLSFSAVELTNYFDSLTSTGGSEFPLRISFFLITFYLLVSCIELGSKAYLNILIGLCSSLSFLWFTDIGFYTNGLIIFYLIVLFLLKNFKQFIITSIGIILSWAIFISIFGINETSNMLFQINANVNFIYYFNFLEFPKPFSNHYASSRALKSLILIILNMIMLINICLKKKYNISTETKLILIFLTISSLMIFKSALVRSDTYHLKYTSGFIFLLFFTQFYFLLLYNLKKLFPSFETLRFDNRLINLTIICLFIFLILSKNINLIKIYDNFNYEIKRVLYMEDKYFLNYKPGMYNYGRIYNEKNYNEDKYFIDAYEKLTKKDNCIQNFTEYLALSYFLNKPTCTEFYNAQFIQHGFTEKKFLESFRKKMPEYILYKSPIMFIDKDGNKQQENLINGTPEVYDFIQENYTFFKSYFNKWIVYKKKLN